MDNTKTITVQILNAFVDNGKGGNPAGVVLNADNLSHQNKIDIAKKVGLSETAFVSNSNTEDFKLDFFTPKKQIAHCGHATVATFSYLKQLGLVKTKTSSKETIDGSRKITLNNDLAFMEQLAPKYTNIDYLKSDILKSLGLTANDLIKNAPILKVNTGNSFVLIPISKSSTLKQLTPNFDLIEKISEELNLIGYYAFTTNVESINLDATARMFAPSYGIKEEAGTGMASGPLACYLYDILKVKQHKFKIQQGKYMNPPSTSLIEVEFNIENNSIVSLMAGGKGQLIKSIDIKIND